MGTVSAGALNQEVDPDAVVHAGRALRQGCFLSDEKNGQPGVVFVAEDCFSKPGSERPLLAKPEA